MRPCAICIHYANNEPRGIEFLGTTTALQIVSCAPLLLCNGIVLVYFAVKGIYVLILRMLKKPLPKQVNIDHCLGYVRRLFHSPQTKFTNSVINKILLQMGSLFQVFSSSVISAYCYLPYLRCRFK